MHDTPGGAEVAAFIKAARAELGLTLEAFGERFGRTKANVHGWEKGLHEPAYAVLATIARESGVPLPRGAQPEPSTNEDRPNTLLDDDELLTQMGLLLARVPGAMRGPFGDVLAGWARDGGADDRRMALLAILGASGKREQPGSA